MIYILLFFASLFRLDDRPTIYIKIGHGWYSSFLKSELTRDWTKTHKGVDKSLEKYNKIRNSFRVVFIFDWLSSDENYIPRWSFDRYGFFTKYDKRAFLCSTFPLLTTKYIIDMKLLDGKTMDELGISAERYIYLKEEEQDIFGYLEDEYEYNGYGLPNFGIPKPPWDDLSR